MSEQKQQKSTTGPGYLEVFVIALIVAVGVATGYDYFFAQKVKVVDLKGFMRTQKALVKTGEISEAQWKANLDRLDQVLNEEAANHPNQVILLKEVVLKNGQEIRIR